MKLSHLTRTAIRLLTGRVSLRTLRAGVVVDTIDDPIGTTRLVRVIGALDDKGIRRLFATWDDIATPRLLHLDLHDAAIVDELAMSALEQAVDRLERQQIGVRIVGIDPYHPALAV